MLLGHFAFTPAGWDDCCEVPGYTPSIPRGIVAFHEAGWQGMFFPRTKAEMLTLTCTEGFVVEGWEDDERDQDEGDRGKGEAKTKRRMKSRRTRRRRGTGTGAGAEVRALTPTPVSLHHLLGEGARARRMSERSWLLPRTS